MPLPAIVNVALDHWYPRAQDRLSAALDEHGFAGAKIFWKHDYPPAAPTQHVVPYGFKVYAIAEALRRGHRLILWTDASTYPVRNVAPVFEHLEAHGHLLIGLGTDIGAWCADDALPALGLTRQAAFGVPSINAAFMGLNFNHPTTVRFFQEWLRLAMDGTAFRAPWVNVPEGPKPLWTFSPNREGFVSADSRVKGHRHDQTAASAIAHRLKMELIAPPQFLSYWDSPPDDQAVFILDRRPMT